MRAKGIVRWAVLATMLPVPTAMAADDDDRWERRREREVREDRREDWRRDRADWERARREEMRREEERREQARRDQLAWERANRDRRNGDRGWYGGPPPWERNRDPYGRLEIWIAVRASSRTSPAGKVQKLCYDGPVTAEASMGVAATHHFAARQSLPGGSSSEEVGSGAARLRRAHPEPSPDGSPTRLGSLLFGTAILDHARLQSPVEHRSRVALLTADASALTNPTLMGTRDTTPHPISRSIRGAAWTDDFANLFSAVAWRPPALISGRTAP